MNTSASFIELPTELLVSIISKLCLTDIIACMRTCSSLHDIIHDDVVLIYHIGLEKSGKIDNSDYSASASRRLEMLAAAESSWTSSRQPILHQSRTAKQPCFLESTGDFEIIALSPDFCIYGSPGPQGQNKISTLYCLNLPRSGDDVSATPIGMKMDASSSEHESFMGVGTSFGDDGLMLVVLK